MNGISRRQKDRNSFVIDSVAKNYVFFLSASCCKIFENGKFYVGKSNMKLESMSLEKSKLGDSLFNENFPTSISTSQLKLTDIPT